MLYIVSGASRAGKTLLAKEILKEGGITYLSLDWLMMGFTNGIPELGIHHLLYPDEIARKSWSFFQAMFKCMIENKENCVIEGEAILPELIQELRSKYPNDVRICFLGYSDVEVDVKYNEVKNNVLNDNDWLIQESDEYILDHIHNMIQHSLMIKKSCEELDFRYIDTGRNFRAGLEEAKRYLLDNLN